MKKTAHYVAVGNDPYSKAGGDLLTDSQNVKLRWVGNHDDFERTPQTLSTGGTYWKPALLWL